MDPTKGEVGIGVWTLIESERNREKNVKEKKWRRRLPAAILIFVLLEALTGCKIVAPKEERQEVGFVIVTEEYIPERLQEVIEQKKEKVMKLTYADQGSSYIVVGYGKQKSGGYSIVVKDVYTAKNTLYVDTGLIGPKQKQETEEAESYPYLVIKMVQLELPVVFQ